MPCGWSANSGPGEEYPVKGKAEHLYSALHGIQTTLKRSGMDHTVLPAINTIPAFLPSATDSLAILCALQMYFRLD